MDLKDKITIIKTLAKNTSGYEETILDECIIRLTMLHVVYTYPDAPHFLQEEIDSGKVQAIKSYMQRTGIPLSDCIQLYDLATAYCKK